MLENIVFTESAPLIGAPACNVDKKKVMLENQEVAVKKKYCNITGKQGFYNSQNTYPILSLIISKRKTLLFSISFLFALLFFIPVFMSVKSYYWEKRRTLEKEQDILYNLFLVHRTSVTQNPTGNPAKPFELPSLMIGEYIIKKGDTLFGIAHQFNVTVDTIITANNLKNAYYLPIGKVLKIPNMSGIFYTVKNGESLFSIAQRFGTSINQIADINDLSSSLIHVGQKLFIRGGALTAWERAIAIGNIFRSPAHGKITSKMGFRIDPFTRRMAYHSGIDIANEIGSPIYAAQYGRVIYTGYRGNYGKCVILLHPQGYSTLYAHLHRITVKKGQQVKQGERIGTMGNTGRSTGPHLHFEVHQNKKLIDPLKVIKMK